LKAEIESSFGIFGARKDSHSASPAQYKAYHVKLLQKTTGLYSSIESYPDQQEILSFLCGRFLDSIFADHIRLQIFPPDRLRMLRGKALAHYIALFDAFVDKLEDHVIFGFGLKSSAPPNSTPAPTRHTGSPAAPTKVTPAKQPHSKVG
jgi:hypothetical protein